jgi:hypothetical protein
VYTVFMGRLEDDKMVFCPVFVESPAFDHLFFQLTLLGSSPPFSFSGFRCGFLFHGVI